MELKRQKPKLIDAEAIFTEQLNDTLRLGFHVLYADAHFRDCSRVVDLLRSMFLELWTLSGQIDRRAAAFGCERALYLEAEPFLKSNEDGSLESLLNHFCRYAKNTSERLATTRQWNDAETVALLDRIVSTANTSIWFLDIYANALWLNWTLSSLPKWKPVSELRQTATQRVA
jgi:hypothetical protein